MVEKDKSRKARKILVTGASGMLGVDLCCELADAYDVIGLDAVAPRNGECGRDFIPCDITDRDKTVESIVKAKPNLVIHAAAWTDVDECEKDPDKAKRINVDGVSNVASAASKLDIPLIYISTDFIFDGKSQKPYTEIDPARPLSIYAKSKMEGEKIVTGLKRYIILRTGWLYGKNGKNFVDTILKAAEKEKELKVVDDQVGSPTYTKDFAAAIGKLLAITKYDIRDVYHISNRGEVSWFDYAKETLKVAGIAKVKVLPIKSEESGRPAKRPAFSVLDNGKFEKVTGFQMRPWQEALREYLNEER